MVFKRCFSSLLFLVLILNTQVIAQSNKKMNNKNSVTDKDITVGAARMRKYLNLLEGKRVAVLSNHTSLIKGVNLVDTLLAKGVDIKKIFTPEHGFRGEADAGAYVESDIDAKTKIPVLSLYGNNKKPTQEQLRDIDIVLFDLQDVGVRFYTYISTLTYLMEACAELNIPVVVLDRPNPNGFYIDGPVLEKKYVSFVGLHCVPVVYGMTIGEYAKMVNEEKWLKGGVYCDLTVIPIKGYKHNMHYQLPVAPSPNLKTMDAVYLYPSLCFFEGTPISVGRGTGKSFQVYGHPEFTKFNYQFIPLSLVGAKNPKFKGEICKGYDLTNQADSIAQNGFLRLDWLKDAYQQIGKDSAFFTRFFYLLSGNSILSKQIQSQLSDEIIRESWQIQINDFKAIRKKHLLYPDFE